MRLPSPKKPRRNMCLWNENSLFTEYMNWIIRHLKTSCTFDRTRSLNRKIRGFLKGKSKGYFMTVKIWTWLEELTQDGSWRKFTAIAMKSMSKRGPSRRQWRTLSGRAKCQTKWFEHFCLPCWAAGRVCHAWRDAPPKARRSLSNHYLPSKHLHWIGL